MSDLNKRSRLNKFEKRRSNTKKLSILIIIAGILIVILLSIWIFGGKDKDTSSPDTESSRTESMELEDDVNSNKENGSNSEVNEETNDQANEDSEINENDEVETEQVESSDDNVIDAYMGNWQPIGTEQEGQHTTNYNDGSQDRIEIKQAVMSVTGLSEDMTEHWVGNDGDQKVVTTVSNQDKSEIYRVYLSWADNQGWQVTKVERLKEI